MNIDKSLKNVMSHNARSYLNPPISLSLRNLNSSSMKAFSFDIGRKTDELLNLAKGSIFFPFTQPTVTSPTGRVIKGRMPSMERVMRNFGVQRRFQNKNDLDGDGVPNKKDCQPRNTMRQDWDVAKAKKKGYYIQWMSPQEYLKRTEGTIETPKEQRKFLSSGYFDIETKKVEPISKLGERIQSPEVKVPLPFVGKKVGTDIPQQEGRHRAYAAELVGEEKIPVKIPPPKEWRTKEVSHKFMEKSFPHLLTKKYKGGGYYSETRERLEKKDFPISYYEGDEELEKAYKEALIETGAVKQEYFEEKKPFKSEIKNIPISEVKEDFEQFPTGPAAEETIKEMKKHIKSGGKLPPILISDEKQLQDGRHRLELYKRLGYKEVPVIEGISPYVSSVEDKETGKELELERGEVQGQSYAYVKDNKQSKQHDIKSGKFLSEHPQEEVDKAYGQFIKRTEDKQEVVLDKNQNEILDVLQKGDALKEDDTLTFYHGTSRKLADEQLKKGQIHTDIFLTPSKTIAQQHAIKSVSEDRPKYKDDKGAVLAVTVPKKSLNTGEVNHYWDMSERPVEEKTKDVIEAFSDDNPKKAVNYLGLVLDAESPHTIKELQNKGQDDIEKVDVIEEIEEQQDTAEEVIDDELEELEKENEEEKE